MLRTVEMLWESPIYKFRVPATNDDPCDELKEVAVDVTLSAPSFSEPGTRLEGVFARVFDYIKDQGASCSRIMDVGAAKLRNTIYLLEKDYSVCAVEFESLFLEPGQAKNNHDRAKSHGKKFCELVFPGEFLKTSTKKFDLVLIVNVLGVMPVPTERLLLLQFCREKLKEKGYLLSYSMYNEPDYNARRTDDVRLGDGHYMAGKGRYKTFYREFTEGELDLMMLSCGFGFEEKFAVTRNHARLYRKHKVVLLDGLIPKTEVANIAIAGKAIPDPVATDPRVVKQDDTTRPLLPNPGRFNLEELWINKLRAIPPGDSGATMFHRVAHVILRRIFDDELKNFTIEEEIHKGRKRIDIVASNRSKSGFFLNLRESHRVHCPWVYIECKNYTNMENPEIDQLAGRLSSKRGLFGFLVHRRSSDRKAIIERCQTLTDRYVLPLDDGDLIRLLEMRVEGADGDIEDFLDNRFKELILKQ